MLKLIQDVSSFHAATGTPILSRTAFPADERVDLRVSLVDEEVNRELLPAIAARDMVKTADGIVDSIYVLVGMALEFGVPLAAVHFVVQRANMAKVDPATGFVRKREDGKILKPEGWQEPDVEGTLLRFGYRP